MERQLLGLVRPVSIFCYLTWGESQPNKKISQREPTSPPESPIHPWYLRVAIFEHHVITVPLNGNGAFLLCPHAAWNAGLS